MDLGIAGRKAIVCASSKGLGRACAMALAEAGCEVAVNGRNRDQLSATAKSLRDATRALVHTFLPGMAERKFGRIINITSGSVRAPIPGLDVSSGARAGLTAFLASAARAHVRDNVTINSIQPGAFDTDRQRSAIERAAGQGGISLEAARAEAQARSPARRFGDPANLAPSVPFWSARAGFITGQNILID